MIDAEIVKCSISLEEFSLEFHVRMAESIEWTKSFDPAGDRSFVYAAGDVWLDSREATVLLIEEQYGANLLSTLSSLKQSIRSLQARPSLEERIPLGGWCNWMKDYWDRFNADASKEEDKSVYDLLIPALLIDGECGRMVAYRHQQALVLEVCTQSKSDASVNVWTEFNSDTLCASIDAVSAQLSTAIRSRL